MDKQTKRPAALLARALLLAFSIVTLVGVGAPVAAVAAPGGSLEVARVSLVEGNATYLDADADDWMPIDINAPLVTGDRFFAPPGGRAEVQLGGGIYARIAGGTELALLDLSATAAQVSVGVGTALVRVTSAPIARRVEIATPGGAIVATQPGLYRFDVHDDGLTSVMVMSGAADAYIGNNRYPLASGRGAQFQVATDNVVDGDVQIFDTASITPDEWDSWEASRQARITNAASYQYVSRDVYGVEDLDQYGTWSNTPRYGSVWRPTRVSSGWRPFTQGRWVWQEPWGWNWVDYQPWGWAPSHYGRWVYIDGWAWAPGPIIPAPRYAPAVVGFLGVNFNPAPGVNVSVGVGGPVGIGVGIGPAVGWVPLGWGEPIVPWWGGYGGAVVGRPWWGGWGGPRIVNNTVINNTTINNINVNNIRYSNFDRPESIVAVSRDGFASGRIDPIDLPRDRIRDIARPLGGAPGIVPNNDSLAPVRPERLRQGRGAIPSQQVLDRAAVVAHDPPAAQPKLRDRIPVIERKGGAPAERSDLTQVASTGGTTGRGLATRRATGAQRITPEVTASAPARAGDRVVPNGRGNAVAAGGIAAGVANAPENNGRGPQDRGVATTEGDRAASDARGGLGRGNANLGDVRGGSSTAEAPAGDASKQNARAGDAGRGMTPAERENAERAARRGGPGADRTLEAGQSQPGAPGATTDERSQARGNRPDAAGQSAARENLGRENAARDAASRENAARQNVDRENAARDTAAREAIRQNATRDNAARDNAARDNAAREGASRDNAARNAARDNAARDNAARENAARDNAARQSAARERAARDNAARQNAARERSMNQQRSMQPRQEMQRQQRPQAQRSQPQPQRSQPQARRPEPKAQPHQPQQKQQRRPEDQSSVRSQRSFARASEPRSQRNFMSAPRQQMSAPRQRASAQSSPSRQSAPRMNSRVEARAARPQQQSARRQQQFARPQQSTRPQPPRPQQASRSKQNQVDASNDSGGRASVNRGRGRGQ